MRSLTDDGWEKIRVSCCLCFDAFTYDLCKGMSQLGRGDGLVDLQFLATIPPSYSIQSLTGVFAAQWSAIAYSSASGLTRP